MPWHRSIPLLLIALCAGSLALGALSPIRQSSLQTSSTAPSDAEIRDRTQKVLSNQHRDDLALEQYERVEHQFIRSAGANPRVIEEKTYRVVPTGLGTYKILLSENGNPVDPAAYHRQMVQWSEALQLALRPDDPRAKTAVEKSEKKRKDRAELVDAAENAFLLKWVGREVKSGRECDVLELSPNPEFHPHSLLQEALTRVKAKIWVDRKENQLVRGEAQVIRDITIGGGILGKLYRGGVFSMEQAEIAPDVWLPVRYQYDFMGRRLLFTFDEHQVIEASKYRMLGTPKQALTIAQAELRADQKPDRGDP